MARRHSQSRRRANRAFRRSAIKTNIKNIPSLNVPRGGVRL